MDVIQHIEQKGCIDEFPFCQDWNDVIGVADPLCGVKIIVNS